MRNGILRSFDVGFIIGKKPSKSGCSIKRLLHPISDRCVLDIHKICHRGTHVFRSGRCVSRYDDTQFINDIDIQYINSLRRFSLIYFRF